jgi:hypothetical protein
MMRLDVHSVVLLAPSGCTSKIAQESNFRTMMVVMPFPACCVPLVGKKKIGSSEQITNASQNMGQSASFFIFIFKLCW